LIYVIRDMPGIETFKIVQENQSRIRVMLVPETGFDPSLHEMIRRGFRARLGETVAVEIESVPAIAAERSGKFRYVQSNVLVQ
jgi:phenylacetate-CoA ligase